MNVASEHTSNISNN